MGFTISFGNSPGTQFANMGFMLLILAIFLFFTGLWRTLSDKWNAFFGSSVWSSTISNIKTTWAMPPQPAPPLQAPGVNQIKTI